MVEYYEMNLAPRKLKSLRVDKILDLEVLIRLQQVHMSRTNILNVAICMNKYEEQTTQSPISDATNLMPQHTVGEYLYTV